MFLRNIFLSLVTVCVWSPLASPAWATPLGAEFLAPMVRYYSLKDAVARLLPGAPVMTRRDVHLTSDQLRRLKTFKNWDSNDTQFELYHARNQRKKITRTVVVFREYTPQGVLLVAVGLSNRGQVTDAILMEAPNRIAQWIQPLLRAGYMQAFAGKDYRMSLEPDLNIQNEEWSALTRNYALRLANAVKKSAQLFQVIFKSGNSS
jgi:hypothetical protein